MSASFLEADNPLTPRSKQTKLLKFNSIREKIGSLIFVLQTLIIWESTNSAPLTLQVHKSISQLGYPSFNIVFLNGVFYSQFGINMYKTTADPNTAWQVVSPKLMTSSPYSTTMLEAIPETNQLLHVDWQGVMTVIDPNDTNAPLKTQMRALFYGLFGNTFPTNMYVYQFRKKYQTVYLYMTEVRGTSLFKIDSSSFTLSKKITDAPQSETGYEHLSVSRNNLIMVLTLNLARMDIYSSTSDTFIKSVTVDNNWGNVVNRGLDHYPLIPTKDYFLVARTGGKAMFYNAVDDMVEGLFSITSEWPEFVRYIPNTHFFVVSHKNKFDFINVLGTDSDCFQFEVPVANSSTYLDFEFYQDNSVSLMAVVTTYGFSTFYNLGSNFCHFSCQACTKSMDPNACSVCKPGYTLTGGVCMANAPVGQVDIGGSIAPACPAGKYQTVDRTCSPCPTDCDSCQIYTGFCLKCLAPNPVISISGTCINACAPTKQFMQTVSSISKCRKCHPSCDTCDGPNDNNCLTCITSTTGTFTYSASLKTCTPPCAGSADAKKSYVLLNDTCDQCYGGCNQCVSSDFSGTCQACSGTAKLMFGYCTSSCSSGMATLTTPYQRCVLCETNPPGQLFHQGACYSSCPSGFVQSGLTCVTAPVTTSPTPAPAPGPTQPTVTGTSGSTTIGGGTTTTTPTSGGTTTTTPDPSTVRNPPADTLQTKVTTEDEKSGPSSGLILIIMIISGAVISLLVICLLYLKKTRGSSPVGQNPNDPTGVINDGTRTRNADRQRNQRQDSADWDLPPIPLQVVNIPESKLIAKQTFSQPPNFGTTPNLAGNKQIKKTHVSGPTMESHSDWQLQGNSNRPLNGRSQQPDLGLESSRINPIHHEDPNRDWDLDEDHEEGQEEGYEDDDGLDSARTPSQAPSNIGQPPPPGANGAIGQSLAASANQPAPRKFQPRGSVKPS